MTPRTAPTSHSIRLGLVLSLAVAAIGLALAASAPRTSDAAIYGEGAWTWDGAGYLSYDGTTRIPGAIAKGVDVSGYDEWIDWDALKAAGVGFAVIRCGEIHRNYSTDESGRDNYFERNMAECDRLGIPYGIYYRSHATNMEEAKTEVDHAARLIEGTHPSLPVYFDTEDANLASTEYNAFFADIHRLFCDRVASMGFTPGVYGNYYWFSNFFVDPAFDNWTRWIADWKNADDDPAESPLCRYRGDYAMWQAGSIEIAGSHYDLDFMIDLSLADWSEFDAAEARARQIAEELAAKRFSDVPADAWFAGYVEYVDAAGVMMGYGDGSGPNRTFGSYDGITRGQIATMLYRIANPGSSATTDPASYGTVSPFSDVPGGQYYTEAIRWCQEMGVVTGYMDADGNVTGFHPDAQITREELATMIGRFAGYYGYSASSADTSLVYAFPDGGSVSGYALSPMAWCIGQSIITGNASTDPPTIKPGDTATRAEAAKMFTVLLRDVL